MTSPNQNELLKETLDAYITAENRVKFAEKLDSELLGGLAIPAINELRCAGRHIVDFLNASVAEDLQEADKSLRKALHHYERAKRDVNDCVAAYYVEACGRFHQDFKDVPKSGVINN